jgi:hypothetical protein
MHEDSEEAIWGGLFFYLSMVIAGCPFYMAISVFYMSGLTLNKYHKFVLVLTMVLSIIFTLSFGRRMAAASGIVFLISPFIVNMLIGSRKLYYLFLFFLLCLIGYLFFQEIIDLFPILQKRLNDNTRGGLFDDLIYDFNIVDWVFGRGLDATYQSPSGLGGDSTRSLVEAGVLDIILHAGIIYLFFFLYMVVRAAYLGIIKGKNTFVRSAGLYLLFYLAMMFSQNRPSFSLDFMMVYLSIYMCGCKEWRKCIINIE